MPTCRNCGGGYFEGITGGMMVGPICRCGNRSTSAAPHRAQAHGLSAGMSPQRSHPQQRLQGQPLSTTTDTVPLGLGIAIGLVLGVVLCLGFVFIF